ncbi:Histone deacetylase clr3 [Neolecta irregularis DAH-3]|uniref:Histone deacetylase clr3 n=1 Tax=Neolecta irregularis (strain DAH-3) TaxID=1198029 RepID=A0A1U7LTR9_NEOID|nr:Histone deacetylase clr3 [Neolecta irregularis DAH-3]|eukprot:OLL26066.1 Histone deacetylase clr3 [Neolecta irregularis DAH-3]
MTEAWNMMKLPIARDYVSESFKDEAVCSPGFYNAETLVLFIHDAPEVYAQTDPLSNKVELHKSFLLDHANTCIEWIMSQNYGLIDVNVPAMLTGVDDPDYTIESATKELCLYTWDNYIELADAKNVIFFGVGKACAGLINLIGARDVTKRVKASLNFIGQDPIKGIQGDDDLKMWYSKHAISYIASNHPLDPEMKAKRRWGQIKKTPRIAMHEILITGFDDAKYFIEKQICEDPQASGNPELKRKAPEL